MFIPKCILFFVFIIASQCRMPDKVFCVDEKCDEPISEARTLLNYNSGDRDLISFRANAKTVVYMKSAGTNPDLWYVEIGDKAGFVNKKFLKETKILSGKPKFEVPLEEALGKESSVQPNKVQQPHEVIEGTTIYTTEAIPQTEPTIAPPFLSTPDLNLVTPSLTKENELNSEKNEKQSSSKESQDKSDLPNVQESLKIVNEFPQNNVNEIIDNLNNESSKEDLVYQNLPVENETKEPGQNENPTENIPLNDVTHTTTEKRLENIPDIAQNYEAETRSNNVENQNEPIVTDSEKLMNESNQSEENKNLEDESEIVVDDYEDYDVEEEESDITDKRPHDTKINSEQDKFVSENTTSSKSDETKPQEDNNILPNSKADTGENLKLIEEVTTQMPVEEVTTQMPVEEVTTQKSVEAVPQKAVEEPTPLKTIEDVPQKPVEQVNNEIKNNKEETLNSKEFKQPEIPKSDINPESESPHLIEKSINENHIPENDVTSELNDLDNYDIDDLNDVSLSENQEKQNTDSWESSTETLPPIFHEAPLTISAKFDSEPLTSTLNPNNEQQDITNSVYVTEEVASDESYTTENILNTLDESVNEDTSTTETQPSESFLSNMYSSIADMWPSSTEEPKSIFNKDDFPHEKVDGEGSFSFINYFIASFSSIFGGGDQTKALFPSAGGSCYTDDYCDGASTEHNNRLLTFLLTTASSVLLFTLGYYYLDNRRQDGRLIGKINSLQRNLLFATKECEILKEELASTKTKLAGIEDSSFGMDDMVQSLKEEINEMKAQNERLRNSLDDNEKLLRVSENTAGELQNTLSEVENTLSELLAERAGAEEQIAELNGKVQAFEEELISVSRDRDNFQLKYVSAETALEEAKKQTKQLDDINKKLAEANNTIALQKHEINALKDAIKELKSGSTSNVDASSLIDHTEIKAKLSKALEEKNLLASKYEIEHNERKRLAEELQQTQETLRTSSQQATESMTRLEVLGKYFQEREGELLKELSTKEALWLSKQGESASTVEKIELLQQEIQRYKEKCDALTLELAEQESSRRSALGEVETRAHNAWLEARAAKREADAARDEAAALRRKLASLSTHPSADGAASPHHKVSSPLESVENSLPGAGLPPLAFLPPLLPPLPRPPPLGRLPSPHPPRIGARDYSPDSRYSPESRYSPVSRYSPETVRYSPNSRYSPRSRRSPYSPRSRRRSRDRYDEGRGSRTRNGPPDTETEYNSGSPLRKPRHRRRYSRHSGPSSGSGCSSESDK